MAEATRKTFPLIFSHPRTPFIVSAQEGTHNLKTLDAKHPGSADFLHQAYTDSPFRIRQINLGSLSGAAVYLLEYDQGFRFVLKVLPTAHQHGENPQLEKACTSIASNAFVSPKLIRADKNFILLPYIGRGDHHPATNQPLLDTEQSFINVLKKLSLLHGSMLIPKQIAGNNITRLTQRATQDFILKHDFLEKYFKQINTHYEDSSAASLRTTHSVFIHANLTPQNIVENHLEAYLIDWGHQPGNGNPYFDLGAVFGMYALDDNTKIKLIRENYPSTVFNKLPEEDSILLKELCLFSALYWFKIALEIIMNSDKSPEQFLELNQAVKLQFGQFELGKTALYETQKRMEQVVELEKSLSHTDRVRNRM